MAKQRKLNYDKRYILSVVRFFAENEPPITFPLKQFGSLEDLDKCLFLALNRVDGEFYDNFSYQRIPQALGVIVYKLYLRFTHVDGPVWFASIELRAFGKEMTEVFHQVSNIGIRDFFLICQLWWEAIEDKDDLFEEASDLLETVFINPRGQQAYYSLAQEPIKEDLLTGFPPTKNEGGTIEAWLDWYHDMKAKKLKLTLKHVADRSGWSHGYIKFRNMIHQSKPNQNITKG